MAEILREATGCHRQESILIALSHQQFPQIQQARTKPPEPLRRHSLDEKSILLTLRLHHHTDVVPSDAIASLKDLRVVGWIAR